MLKPGVAVCIISVATKKASAQTAPFGGVARCGHVLSLFFRCRQQLARLPLVVSQQRLRSHRDPSSANCAALKAAQLCCFRANFCGRRRGLRMRVDACSLASQLFSDSQSLAQDASSSFDGRLLRRHRHRNRRRTSRRHVSRQCDVMRR